MKREDAKYPYNEYYIYKIFHSKEKRFYALLIHKYDNEILEGYTKFV